VASTSSSAVRRRWALALAFLVCALYPAGAQAKEVLLRPEGSTDRVVIYVHGSGGSASDISPVAQSAFLENGFAVAATDADGRQNWGNPASVADYEHLISRLRKRGYTRVFLWAGSMGGLDAMQLLATVEPEALELNSPVCDISHLAPTLTPAIEEGWGEERPEYLEPVIPSPAYRLPVRIWASPEDTWVPKQWNANVCARELRRHGANVFESPTEGNHPEAAPKGGGMLYFFQQVAARNKARGRYEYVPPSRSPLTGAVDPL
jgi:pimeloyl-ACP methyl ester carboxylesterase